MNKLALAATSALLSLTALSANAEMCLEFDNYCDGLQIAAVDGVISGIWWNLDCAGATAPIEGFHGEGVAKVGCLDAACTDNFDGVMFGWVEQLPADGAMNMYVSWGDEVWESWIPDLSYTLYDGPCIGSQSQGGISSTGR